MIKFTCIKEYKKDSVHFIEGNIYLGKEDIDEDDHFYILYPDDRHDDFYCQIFNSKYSTDLLNGIFPYIRDYFVNIAEWRDEQIDSILND